MADRIAEAPSPASPGAEPLVRTTIERLVFQGAGLARLPDGRACFVPYTAPGDEVEIRIAESRGDFVRGELVRLLQPSPERARPPCRYFGICGGCQWQHLAYPAQLDWKRQVLVELLRRIGKLGDIPVAAPMAPGSPWAYRARAQFKVSRERPARIGFHERESHRVVDIGDCPLLDPRVSAVLRSLRGMRHPELTALFPRLQEIWVSAGTGTGDVLLSLFARPRERGALRHLYHIVREAAPGLRGIVLLEGQPREQPRVLDRHGEGTLREQVGEYRFRMSATAFFQVNGLAADTLTALVVEGGAFQGTDRVLDLYAGVGTFTVPLAGRVREVVSVEANPAAATDAGHNLRANARANVRLVQAPVERALPRLATEGRWDVAVLDPPRQGASRDVLDTLTRMRIPRLLYVSCDPSTLARDLGILTGAGYRCLQIQPVDLFPQTFHLESVAVLERASD